MTRFEKIQTAIALIFGSAPLIADVVLIVSA